MDETTDTTALMARLLAVMPADWWCKLSDHIERVVTETGYGEVGVVIYRGKVVQVIRIVKDR